MAFTKAPISAVITDATGNTINLGNASGAFTSAPTSIVLTDANGNTLNVGPGVVAVYDAVAQQANIGATALYTVPAGSGGMYRLSGYAVVTQAATTSSTLSRILYGYTDADTSVVFAANSWILVNGTSNNTLGANSLSGTVAAHPVFRAKAGTVINFSVDQYASSGATPMQYAIHLKLEYLGA